MMTSQLPILQIIVPMLVAPLIILLRPASLAWLAATVTSAMAFVIAIGLAATVMQGSDLQYALGSWAAPYGIELRIDSFSALLLLLTNGSSTIALIAGRKSIESQIDAARQPTFYATWLIALAGMSGIVVSGDAFNIFVFMEIASLASYALIAAGSDKRALPATFKYIVMGTVGATFYLIGVGLIYMMTGTLNLADMNERIHEVSELRPILVAAGFVTVGLALKAAVFPLHVWLPKAYTFAPHIVTAFVAACSTKVALYVLLRFDFVVFQPNLIGHDVQFAVFLMPLAVLAILIASLVAIFEPNIKRLLAYSSIAQVGYILLGASFVTATGLTASIIHMFNHALAKGALFLAVACLAMQFSRLRLEDLGGAGRAMPWTMGAFVVAGLSLIGVPGTAGFISKWYLVSAALQEGMLGGFMVAAILVSSLMAVVYIWRIVEVAYFGEADANRQAVGEAPFTLLSVTWVAALANIYFGLNASVPLSLSESAAQTLMDYLP